MDTLASRSIEGDCSSEARSEDADASLIRLCEAFIRHAEARTVEGDRLDRLPWSNELNDSYVELNRDAREHGAMLAVILAAQPKTLQGLLAKARVISRHQRDVDAEPIAAGILAMDVLRVIGAQEDGAASRSAAAWPAAPGSRIRG